MSSFNRQHHGRSRPPPARNRSGFHPQTSTNSPDVDPHYLDYLRSQAAQLTQQITELSQPRYSSQQFQSRTTQFRPNPISIPSSSHHRQAKPSRNPSREGSKWRFYAVKNGINGDDVYSSWNQAHPFCWDPSTQYFFPGCFCKGFDSYDSAWDFLLDVPKEAEPVSAMMDSSAHLNHLALRSRQSQLSLLGTICHHRYPMMTPM